MPRGYHIGIGLNECDPAQYGSKLELGACVQDAEDMAAIARELGYQKQKILLNSEANYRNVASALKAAAEWCQAGDTCLFTYSGHGTRVPDKDGDEKDGCDEALVLHDRLLIDDELKSLIDGFRAGVRFVMLSDSCHSATQARLLSRSADIPREKIRAATWESARFYWSRNADRHPLLPKTGPMPGRGPEVVSLNACKDDQTALDGLRNGSFTAAFLSAWRDARNWDDLRSKIEHRTPMTQIPVLIGVGASKAFLRSKPLRLAA